MNGANLPEVGDHGLEVLYVITFGADDFIDYTIPLPLFVRNVVSNGEDLALPLTLFLALTLFLFLIILLGFLAEDPQRIHFFRGSERLGRRRNTSRGLVTPATFHGPKY